MSCFRGTVWPMWSTCFFVAYRFILFHFLLGLFRDSEVRSFAGALLDAGTLKRAGFAGLRAGALA